MVSGKDIEFDITGYVQEFDLEELYSQFVLADTMEAKLRHRQALRSRARHQLQEYEAMTEEEKEEFEKEHNKDNRYTKEQLEEIADSEIEVPEKFGSGDLKARPIKECREILEVLMENFDPTKGRPIWNSSVNQLRDQDISISAPILKRYWTAIQEKDAFKLVKEKLYWNIIESMEGTTEALVEHILNRVGGKGEEYDNIENRANALVKIIEMLKNLPYDQAQRVQVQEKKQETKKITIEEYSEDQIQEIEENGFVDIDEE